MTPEELEHNVEVITLMFMGLVCAFSIVSMWRRYK